MRTWSNAVLLLALTTACGSDKSTCDLAAQLRARAGGHPTDCGHAVLGSSASEVDICVVLAFNAGDAFMAQYDRRGIDSKVVFGLAADSQGKVTFLLFDGDPSGGSGAEPVVTGDLCVEPSLDASSERDPFVAAPITCVSTTSLGHTCG